MAISTLSEKDLLEIEDGIKSLTNDIFTIQKHNVSILGRQESFEALAPLFNIKSMIESTKFNYLMPLGTIENPDKGIRALISSIDMPDEKIKERVLIRLEALMEKNNRKFRSATKEELQGSKATFLAHYRDFVFSSKDSFEYQNKHGDNKNVKLSESTRTIKDAAKNVLSTIITKLGFDKENPKVRNEFINDQHRYIVSGKSQSLFTTTAKDFFSLFVPKDENSSGLDAKFNPQDGVLTVNSGKVRLGAGVELVEASGEVKAEPTPVVPVAVKPTQIEQPKPAAPAKTVTPATPVAQAKPNPAPAPVAKPEPAVSKAEAFLATVAVVDADEDEQAMLDELPEDL